MTKELLSPYDRESASIASMVVIYLFFGRSRWNDLISPVVNILGYLSLTFSHGLTLNTLGQ